MTQGQPQPCDLESRSLAGGQRVPSHKKVSFKTNHWQSDFFSHVDASRESLGSYKQSFWCQWNIVQSLKL